MKTIAAALVACAALLLAACGGATTTEAPLGHGDAGAATDGPHPGTTLGACGAGGSCPTGASCYFKIGSCSAVGECVEDPAPGTPQCGAIEELCGCGSNVVTGCGFPGGYGSGPALGSGDCQGGPSSGTASSTDTSGGSSSISRTSSGNTVFTGSSSSTSGAASSTSSMSGGASSTSSKSGSASSAQSSLPPVTTCPETPPTVGVACEVAFDCEYGTDPDVACNTVYSCEGTGEWVISSSPSASGCGATSSTICPEAYAALRADGATCPRSLVGTTCVYPQARCSCEERCGMEVVKHRAVWCCPDAPLVETGCPTPRPRLGIVCQAASSLTCDYGGCGGNVDESCVDGVWQKQTMFGCPG